MNWHEYAVKSGKLPEWPYPVNYGKENLVESDVLVIGGGVAGCRAAIEALKRGATVAVADRGFSKRSGMGGVGAVGVHDRARSRLSSMPRNAGSAAAAWRNARAAQSRLWRLPNSASQLSGREKKLARSSAWG
jgi:glycine/D-amino acid oxidase-like deaminating enzyme